MKTPKNAFTGSMFKRLFIPAFIAALGMAFSDMADAIVVAGKLDDIGPAAIGMTLPLYMIINVCMHGFGIGGSVRFAKLMSVGEHDEAVLSFNRILRAALLVSLGIAAVVNLFPTQAMALMGVTPEDGLLFEATFDYARIIALGAPLFFLCYILNYYLRNDDLAGAATAGFLTGNVVDIVLNVVFVYQFDWGTAGAAFATLIGLTVTLCWYVVTLLQKKHVLRLLFRPIGMKWKDVGQMYVSGFSTSSQYLWQLAFLLIANHTLMAHLGSPGVTIMDMLQNASYLILYIFDAAVKAMQPIASTLYGEKNYADARAVRSLAMRVGLGVGLVIILGICIFPEAVCGLFGLSDPAILGDAVAALRIYCAGVVFAGVLLLLEGYYQAVDEERSAFVITLLRGCVVLIPVTLLLGVFAPDAFWWLFPVTEVLSVLLFLLWRKFLYKPCPAIAPESIFSGAIHSRTDDIGALTQQIEAFCEQHEASIRQQYFVTMAVEEITLAIMNGGFGARTDGTIQLTLIALDGGEFELHIRDNAATFNPFALHTEKVGEDDFDADAMGIAVIKQQAKSFFYRHYQGFNTLIARI